MDPSLTADAVYDYMENELARHSLQHNLGELRHIRRVAAFIARVADDLGDSTNQRRFLLLFDVASQAMNNQPLSS